MAARIQKPLARMRKRPAQPRAEGTVEAIVEAAAHILSSEGWRGFNTNAVARAAGVSIGSLYQYFPNKLSLLEVLRERHMREVLEVLCAASDRSHAREQRLSAFVDRMLAIHSQFPALYSVLLEECPYGEEFRKVLQAFQRAWMKGYEEIVRVNSVRAPSAPRTTAIVLAGALVGAVHEASRRGSLTDPITRQELMKVVDAILN